MSHNLGIALAREYLVVVSLCVILVWEFLLAVSFVYEVSFGITLSREYLVAVFVVCHRGL